VEDVDDPNLLVGLSGADDAGVYKISEDTALVQTVDVFTPIVDDPYVYGLIAAANSLSDIYAMGAKPITALNVSCFTTEVPPKMLADILLGSLEKLKESGTVLLGGHTVTDKELKYGLAVTGLIHPDEIITNAGAKPGDKLILTKAIGTGIMSTALKNGTIGDDEFEEAVDSMATLNKVASEAMQKIGVNACTDVTGFGLAGHLFEMLDASGVSCRLQFAKIPFLNGLFKLIEQDEVPGGAFANQRYFGKHFIYQDELSEAEKIGFFDPQTSGGLLISVPAKCADELLNELKDKKVKAEMIGEILDNTTNKNKKVIVKR